MGESKQPEDAAAALVRASTGVFAAVGRRPWTHGWCLPDYRHSDEAALTGQSGSVALTDEAIAALEYAVSVLLRRPAIRERWDADEVWGTVALLVVAASYRAEKAAAVIAQGLERLDSALPVLSAQLVANVEWASGPRVVADSVIGLLSDEWATAVNLQAAGRPGIDRAAVGDWWESQDRHYGVPGADEAVPPPGLPVVFACWTVAQGMRAVKEAEEKLRQIVDFALLLEPDPEGLGLFGVRGSANRPGVRGLHLDRAAIEWLLGQAGEASAELGAETLLVTSGGAEFHHGWYSADPFPLEVMLEKNDRRELLNQYLAASSPVARRLRIAARWTAEAHWALEMDEAALALGVAMDALLGETGALPGRIMAQRFAFLEPDATRREERARRYSEIYRVRSSVAHGGQARELSDGHYARGVAREVGWAARRVIELDRTFRPISRDEFSRLFDTLAWGTTVWP